MLEDLIKRRIDHDKPRSEGLTCVTDKLQVLSDDNLSILAPFIDIIKIPGSMVILMSEGALKKRISIYHNYNIKVSLGSTIVELAISNNSFRNLVKKAKDVGFDIVELGENNVTLNEEEKERLIEIIRSYELEFITKVGKKDPRRQLDVEEMLRKIKESIRLGSKKVILEASNGYNVGIYDEKGFIKWSVLASLTSQHPPSTFIFEAPLQSQQSTLIAEFGERVNLAELTFNDVITVETQRRGFLSRPAFNILTIKKELGGGPAVKFVYYIISNKYPIEQSEIINLTNLPRRTIQNALEYLKKQGLIIERNSLEDARKKLYYPVQSEWL